MTFPLGLPFTTISEDSNLELPPIGWQLFILGNSKSDSTAFPLFLDTYATRLLAEPLSCKERKSVLDASKGIYLGGTLLSILLSLYLFTSGRRQTGIFVGLWAPTVLNLGQALLEDNLAKQPTWRERILSGR